MQVLDYIFAARPMLHLPVWSVYLVTLHYNFESSPRAFQWADLKLLGKVAAMVNRVTEESPETSVKQ